jgi:hypothetical protein
MFRSDTITNGQGRSSRCADNPDGEMSMAVERTDDMDSTMKVQDRATLISVVHDGRFRGDLTRGQRFETAPWDRKLPVARVNVLSVVPNFWRTAGGGSQSAKSCDVRAATSLLLNLIRPRSEFRGTGSPDHARNDRIRR